MKRPISVILACIMLLAGVFCAPVFTDAAREPAPITKRSLELINEELWEGRVGVSSISHRKNADNSILSVSALPDTSAISFASELEAQDLSGLTELAFRVSLRGKAESYTVTVELFSEAVSSSHRLTVDREAEYIYVPLAESVRSALTSIIVTVDAGGKDISYINVFEIWADNDFTYSYLNLFAASTVTPDCPSERDEKGVTLLTEDGSCSVGVDFSLAKDTETDRELLIWLSTSEVSNGTLSLTCKYSTESEDVGADPQKKDRYVYTTTPTRSMAVGTTFFFTVKGGFESCEFNFSSLEENSAIRLTGAGLADMGVADNGVGTVSALRYADGELSLTGSLSNDASLEYYGSKLLLFAIPFENAKSYDLSKLEPVCSTGFSTIFELNCKMGADYSEYLYLTVLDTDGGYVPVGSPRTVASVTSSLTVSPFVTALHGSDAADVFDTNVSGVILDVCAGQLLDVDDVYSAEHYIYNGSYYFDRDYLSRLDNDIRFFSASGVKVYLRIYSDRDGYLFDYSPDDPDSLALMAAVASFISSRYDSVAGYIAGAPLNRDTSAATPEYAERKARLISAFLECIRTNDADADVFIPFEAAEKSDPALTAAMLGYYLAGYGAAPSAILLESPSPDADLSKRAAAAASAFSVFTQSPAGCALLWNVPQSATPADITKGYGTVCKADGSGNLRFAAISLSKAQKSTELFSALKEMLDSENVTSSPTSHYLATLPDESFAPAAFGIWDFTDSYDTRGWVSGGSFSVPVTAKGISKGRVLKAPNDPSQKGAGILIGSAPTPLDMTGTVARVTLAVLSDTTEKADISIIFGSKDARAQFSCTVDCNTQISLLCDMAPYKGASRVEYAAVIVRGVENAQAELSKIELCSTSLTEEELKARYHTPEEDSHDPLLYAALIVIAAATVAIFSMLLKKKRPPKDKV